LNTHKASNDLRAAAFISASKAGLLAFVPLKPVSMNSPTIRQPRRPQYSRSSKHHEYDEISLRSLRQILK
jgi:hypothetical protein